MTRNRLILALVADPGDRCRRISRVRQRPPRRRRRAAGARDSRPRARAADDRPERRRERPTAAHRALDRDAPTATVAGTWTVTADSQAGYRVRERLANLDAESDAVGRTNDVTGTITVVEAADGRAADGRRDRHRHDDASTSDEDRRDNRLRSEGLQTDQFPTATFMLTQPVDVPATAIAGTATDVTLVGDLTLHGVTKSVEIPAQAQLTDGQIQVAGSLTFPLADFDITAPNVGGFIISIADEGALEFLVVFAKA